MEWEFTHYMGLDCEMGAPVKSVYQSGQVKTEAEIKELKEQIKKVRQRKSDIFVFVVALKAITVANYNPFIRKT